MDIDEKIAQSLLGLHRTRIEIRRKVYIETLIKNTNKPYEECYYVADTAAWNYIKCVCDNNEVFENIRNALLEIEDETINYANMSANGSDLAADEIS